MDVHSKTTRSFNMSQIKGCNTKLEIKLRKALWASGTRGYRINQKIYGKPDIYFPKTKLAVFVDGCFWHKCPTCYVEPKSNIDFWLQKITENINRDHKVNKKLHSENIKVIRLWEHELKQKQSNVITKIRKTLGLIPNSLKSTVTVH